MRRHEKIPSRAQRHMGSPSTSNDLFLGGSSDSFRFTSLRCSESQAFDDHSVADINDFMSMVTSISHAYQRNAYLDMRPLDETSWNDLDPGGSSFTVSSTELAFKTASALQRRSRATITDKIVIKKANRSSMDGNAIQKFNRELRVLDHMRGSPNIVNFRGVGWFYNYDLLVPYPQPVLMLEQAVGSMKILLSPTADLATKTMMSVFRDVANGLQALHAHGIVHGDMKPDNVLLFAGGRHDEGAPVETYTAKISDFNLAVVDNGRLQTHLGGTDKYKPPEYGRLLSFSDLQLSDVYSLGVLYAEVSCKNEELEELKPSLLEDNSNQVSDAFARRVIELAEVATEGSAMPQTLLQLARNLFGCTLRLNPIERSLQRLLKSFDAYLGDSPARSSEQAVTMRQADASDLTIGYSTFKDLGGLVKDHIIDSLSEIIHRGRADPRYAKALCEHGILQIAGYVNPTASVAKGMDSILCAAEEGNLLAKALYGRLSLAYDLAPDQRHVTRRLAWLVDAASAGYQPAIDELYAVDSSKAFLAMSEYGSQWITAVFARQNCTSDLPGNKDSSSDQASLQQANFLVHQSSAKGEVNILLDLLKQYPDALNLRNQLGDTPLICACRFGHHEVVLALLDLGADASLYNDARENALHFLWRFSLRQSRILLPKLLAAGAQAEQEASSSEVQIGWDLIPTLAGSPIERVAARNRLDIVQLMLRAGVKISPRNGNKMRRMLLLAMRLQHCSIQQFLIQYATTGMADTRDDLRPLHDVIWYHKGRSRSYLDAALLGCVGHTVLGVDLPIDVWQACHHGRGHLSAMKESIAVGLRLREASQIDEKALDKAIQLAIRESAFEALRQLLDMKILHTNGTHARMTSLKDLCWWPGRPVHPLAFIDQICFPRRNDTLAQQALRRGDRKMFHILTHEYGADLTLPFYMSGSSTEQINCYSAVTQTTHQDGWFYNELSELHIPLEVPFEADSDMVPNSVFKTPLHFALRQNSWTLSDWLIKRGCRLFNDSESGFSTLSGLFSPGAHSTKVLDHLFCQDETRKATVWNGIIHGARNNGYDIFEEFYDSVLQRPDPEAEWLNEQRPGKKDEESYSPEEKAVLIRCWLSLLEICPNVDNKPDPFGPSILTMTRWMYRKLSPSEESAISFQLLIVPTVRATVTITSGKDGRVVVKPLPRSDNNIRRQTISTAIASFFHGSPLDRVTVAELYRSGLIKDGYLPSLWHRSINVPLFGSLTSFFSLIIWFITRYITWNWGPIFWFGLCAAGLVFGFLGPPILLIATSVVAGMIVFLVLILGPYAGIRALREIIVRNTGILIWPRRWSVTKLIDKILDFPYGHYLLKGLLRLPV